jgi:hypothetical protein
MKAPTRRGTPTDVYVRGERKHCISEQDAYIWTLERFLRLRPNAFRSTVRDLQYICRGRRGAVYFSAFGNQLRKPHLLSNGWHAELQISNDQKIRCLAKIAIALRLSYGKDWTWDALNRYTREPIDPDALLDELMGGDPRPPHPCGPNVGET